MDEAMREAMVILLIVVVTFAVTVPVLRRRAKRKGQD